MAEPSAPCPRCGSVAYEAFGDPPDIFEGGALELTAEHAADLLQPDLEPVADPDAERPCSCEESVGLRQRLKDYGDANLKLQARVAELVEENARTLALWKEDESRGIAREAHLESEARALRADNESHVARCYAAEADAGACRRRVVDLESYSQQLAKSHDALREKIERAVEIMSRFVVKTASECEALEVLRG